MSSPSSGPPNTAATTRVLVPLDGSWQAGDVVKQSTFGRWHYMTLGRDGWRDSTPAEIAAYEGRSDIRYEGSQA